MGDPAVKKLVQAAASDPKLLRTLKTNPDQIAKQFKLDKAQMAALRSANRLLVIGSPLAGTVTYTFQTGTTIKIGLGGLLKLGPKSKLINLLPKK